MRETSTSERERLDSWKAIAAFLGRDERTAQRWEKEHRLPIHRLPGERGGVFAFKDELLLWLQPHDGNTQDTVAAGPLAAQGSIGATPPLELAGYGGSSSFAMRRWRVVLITCCLFTSAAGWELRLHRAKNHALESAGAVLRETTVPAALMDTRMEKSQAREIYLSGKFFASQRTRESLLKAADAFTKAIGEDPHFSSAYTGLAETYELMPEFGTMPPDTAFPLALAAAQQAVALDSQSADAHRVLAFALFYWEWRTNLGLVEFERAIALDPRDAQTHHWYANALLTVRQLDEATKEIQIARELDPTAKAILADEILIEAARRPAEPQSVAHLQDLSRAEPTFISPMRYASWLLYDSRQYALWVEELQAIASTTRDPVDISIARAAKTGWEKGEKALLMNVLKAEESAQGSAQISDVELGLLWVRAGDIRRALHFLRAAYAMHDFRLLVLVSQPADPLLRGNPEYEKIQNQVRAIMTS